MDGIQCYRGPLTRTMAGYKLISSSFLLCGLIAVPTLLNTGDQGILGASMVGIASILPIGLQILLVPGYVVQINLASKTKQTGLKVLGELNKDTKLKIHYFSHFGIVRSRITRIGDLSPVTSRRLVNYRDSRGKYWIDSSRSPIMAKITSISKSQ